MSGIGTEAGQVTAGPATGGRARTSALVLISAAQLMLLLDSTIVNVALPAIQESLGIHGAELEWVVSGYSLAFGGLLLLGGRAGDILGRRRVFTAGLALFTAASLLGGFASEPWMLLVSRAAQGVGAAAASPAALSLIATTFPEGRERNRAIGIYTAAATSGGGVGLLAGGLITTYLSWRWILFVNVPVGTLMIALAWKLLPETERSRKRLDLPGALTGTLGITLLVYGLINAATDETGRQHWADPDVLLTLAASALLIAAFARIERRAAHPLVPLRILTDRARAGTYLILTLSSTAMFGIFFFLTLFLQQVWNYTPLKTALGYLPLTCLLMYSTSLGGRLLGTLSARTLVPGGLTIAAAGMFWLSRIGDSAGYWTGLLPPTILTYLGLGVISVPLTAAALSGISAEDSGIASGLFSTARQVGGATGLAVLGTVVWASAAHSSLSVAAGHGFAVAGAAAAVAALVALATVPRVRKEPGA
ncbi:MFS transporter [Streptomyces meridianus]|uniref:MFS transporter n=1 Tax=Streptomyces meridianus TaxID=2938945 RepID=A0ABT0X4F4_9ACTN|nr:MFS transporter [Streptomyces meridianus]MCM2576542.1 MFS transporter [Streptomyces meridianus]